MLPVFFCRNFHCEFCYNFFNSSQKFLACKIGMNAMKIDTRYNSMWDNLPPKYEGRIPATQKEAEEFYEAAEASRHDSLMKTIDAHNESMREAAELRKKTQRKKEIEQQVIERRENQREIFEAEALKAEKRRKHAIIIA